MKQVANSIRDIEAIMIFKNMSSDSILGYIELIFSISNRQIKNIRKEILNSTYMKIDFYQF